MMRDPFLDTSCGSSTEDRVSFGLTYERYRTLKGQTPTLLIGTGVVTVPETATRTFVSHPGEGLRCVTTSSTTVTLDSTHSDSRLPDPHRWDKGDRYTGNTSPIVYLLTPGQGVSMVTLCRRERRRSPTPPDGQTSTDRPRHSPLTRG